MHGKLSSMYKPSCAHVVHLADNSDDFTVPKELEQAFNNAVQYIHQKKGFTAKDLGNKSVKPLIRGINNVLQNSVQSGLKTEIPTDMLAMLKRDVFIFSGLKTYAELKEVSLLLLDDSGKIKSWPSFRNDVINIHSTYNENYLRAEHQHAIGTASAVSKWVDWEKDADKYDLQIRTAGDDVVRYSHTLLDRITLPFSDPFWLTHMIPFDWGCRCNIVQVLKGKYPVTDSNTAMQHGNKAVPEMMRYNPAIEGVIFPPKHPYSKLSSDAKKILEKEFKSTLKENKKRFDEFEKLLSNENYTDVKFNGTTGGLKATHKLHHFDPKKGKYEKQVSDILYHAGNKIILEEETTGSTKKIDGFLNDKKTEISTLTGTGKNTIKHGLNHCREKGASSAILYFPNSEDFSEQRFLVGVAKYEGQTKYRFEKIVVIVGNDIIRQ